MTSASAPLEMAHGRKQVPAVRTAAAIWLATAVAGQWAFCLSLLTFYGGPLIAGHVEAWNSHPLLVHPPVVDSAPVSAAAFGLHALGAGVVAFVGALQFIPAIRRRAPGVHRWSGRIFTVLVVAVSLSGFYLVWIRGPRPETFAEYGTSLNGLLILTCAALTVFHAMGKRFAVHERWALRLYLVANAQWFFRIGAFGYFMAGKVASAEVSFDDGFFKFWAFGCFLVPLAVAQLYLYARRSESTALRRTAVAVLAVSTLMTLWGEAILSLVLVKLAQGTLSV